MMKKIIIILLSLLIFSNVDTKSQIKPKREVPTLKAKNDKGQRNSVQLVKLQIDVSIFGNIAKTSMTMTFANMTDRDLEGELTFPMPEGVSVSGYALDINGKLRQAVPIDKNKGTEIFESIETRRVDPGLLEKVEGNNFRTRIYPLPAKGKRTVQISYSENLKTESDQALYYYLPLNYNTIIDNFDLAVKVYQGNQKPNFTEQLDETLLFSEHNHNYTATLQRQHYKPQKNITIKIPVTSKLSTGLKQANQDGSFYFLANARINLTKPEQKKWGNQVSIIWDKSLSGKNRDLEKEFALLNEFFKNNPDMIVELGLLDIRFKKAQIFRIEKGNWSALKNYLNQLSYDGGTDYSQVKSGVLHGTNYLFFSDGLSTFGQSQIALDRPVYCISSSNGSDYANLKQIAQKNSGKMINLTNSSIDQAFINLSTVDLLFLGIKEHEGFEEVYPEKGTPVQSYFSVAGLGKHDNLKQMTLLIGDGQQIRQEIKVALTPDNSEINLQQIWAQQKIETLDLQYEDHREEIEALGKQFGIVTRNTSLIVLEEIADYVRYNIIPPTELLAEFNAIKKENSIEQEKRVSDLLTQAQQNIEELRSWWNTDFKQKHKYPQRKESISPTQPAVVQEEPAPRPMARQEENNMAHKREDYRISEVAVADLDTKVAITNNNELMEVVTVSRLNSINNETVGKISIPEIKEDNEYLQEIVQSKDPYKSYLQLRENYMGTPNFYFDIANFFFKKGDREQALLILSTLADLEIENADLYKTISYKLREWGDYDKALFITEKILKWRPMDPQSHRDYALSLQDKGRYEEAIEELYRILTQNYSPEAADRDDGIEEIILMEINNLVSLKKTALNNITLDKKLIADLPVDIRVVINWNSQNTDIDLWVTDPNGEKCFYSNPATAIGGRLSNDFTGGYGPEQFLLKKAQKGKYKIEVDFYDDSSLTLAGPASVMAEIYTYYSSGRQERKITTLYLDRTKEQNTAIGEFTF